MNNNQEVWLRQVEDMIIKTVDMLSDFDKPCETMGASSSVLNDALKLIRKVKLEDQARRK